MQNNFSPSPDVAVAFSRIGPVTRAMVQARTHALAVRAGRVPPHVTQTDYEKAKREITGESDLDRQNAILDSNLLLGRCEPSRQSTTQPAGNDDRSGSDPAQSADSAAA